MGSACRSAAILRAPCGQIPYPRQRAQLFLEPEASAFAKRLGERNRLHAVGHSVFPKIAEEDGAVPHLGGTGSDACGKFPVLREVGAEHALLYGSNAVGPRLLDGIRVAEFLREVHRFRPVEGPRIVGAGRHAIAAPDAAVVVDLDDPVIPPERSVYGAHLDAWRVVALHARSGQEVLCPELLLDLEDLDPLLPLGHEVLPTAPLRALSTSVAPGEVDEHDPLFALTGEGAGIRRGPPDDLEDPVGREEADRPGRDAAGDELEESAPRDLPVLAFAHHPSSWTFFAHFMRCSQNVSPWPMQASRSCITPEPIPAATPSWNPSSR